jgi:DNA invertase Pin-like site-specific DNA recombinase
MGKKKAKDVLQAWGYARVSSMDQVVNGVSLDAQTEGIRGWCVVNGYQLAGVMVDRGISGGRCSNRPALQEALKVVARGNALVVYSLSRLARSTRDTLAIADTLDRRGADLVSLSEKLDTTTASGRLMFRMLAVLGEFEADTISDRTRDAMAHLRAQGRFCGGRPPYGKKIEGQRVVADSAEQKVIQRIRDLRASGLTLRSICAVLADMGIRNRADGIMNVTQVRRVLLGEGAGCRARRGPRVPPARTGDSANGAPLTQPEEVPGQGSRS